MEDRRNTKTGLSPGTLVHVGDKRMHDVVVHIVDFNPDEIIDDYDTTTEDVIPSSEKHVRWIHINGVHDTEIIENICADFGIHPLIAEDIASTEQRPRFDLIEQGLYIVIKAFQHRKERDSISAEQVSIILRRGLVISFQESEEDLFEPIRKRLQHAEGRLRASGSDYLTYTMLDLIVDYYFDVLVELGFKIESLEDQIIVSVDQSTLGKIYRLKRSLIMLRRHIWPLREVVLRMNRDEINIIADENEPFLRDLYDHVIRVTDHIETYRESVTGMLDIYMSGMSNKMNEVMKVLTVVSVIFIPLSLMAGIYGMNFDIPETEHPFGYPIFLISMLVISLIMAYYFRKIDWI